VSNDLNSKQWVTDAFDSLDKVQSTSQESEPEFFQCRWQNKCESGFQIKFASKQDSCSGFKERKRVGQFQSAG
jgi:hypothetical protein